MLSNSRAIWDSFLLPLGSPGLYFACELHYFLFAYNEISLGSTGQPLLFIFLLVRVKITGVCHHTQLWILGVIGVCWRILLDPSEITTLNQLCLGLIAQILFLPPKLLRVCNLQFSTSVLWGMVTEPLGLERWLLSVTSVWKWKCVLWVLLPHHCLFSTHTSVIWTEPGWFFP